MTFWIALWIVFLLAMSIAPVLPGLRAAKQSGAVRLGERTDALGAGGDRCE